MFKKNNEDRELLVEEQQYRAVITKVKGGWSASVQVRKGIDEWKKVRCGLKGVVFATNKQAEDVARLKIREQKSLDKDTRSDAQSYIIFDAN